MKKLYHLFFISSILLISSCTVNNENKNSEDKTIRIRELADASTLNPISVKDELSSYLSMQLYQSLIGIDYKSEKVVGILAKSAPSSEIDSLGNIVLTYQIRPEAKFDNGRTISPKDVLFSLKLNVCPLVNNLGGAYYYGFVKDFIFSSTNPQEFKIVCRNAAILNQFRSGDFAILPSETYDSLDILTNYKLDDLLNNEELENDTLIQQFAEQFNAMTLGIDPALFEGSGAYELDKWQKGERILLKRKSDWWGNTLKNENCFFIANASALQYEIINDPITAQTALKAGEIDFMRNIKAKDFESIKLKENLNTEIVERYSFTYLGFNLNNPILSELNVRKAIESALPLDNIIQTVFQGEAIKNRLPIPIQLKKLRNNNIVFPEYNLEKSTELLKQANWVDSDDNGILDKLINDERIELSLSFYFNTGNEARESIGLILKNELQKLGIQLEVIGLEWTTYLQKLRNNEIEVFVSGFSSAPLTPDFTNSFHSKSANGGRNYANYENNAVDSLIDAINIELNEEKRIKLIHDFQLIIAQESPYLILLTKMERIAYSSKLKKVNIYAQRPHYWAPELY